MKVTIVGAGNVGATAANVIFAKNKYTSFAERGLL